MRQIIAQTDFWFAVQYTNIVWIYNISGARVAESLAYSPELFQMWFNSTPHFGTGDLEANKPASIKTIHFFK